LTLGWAASVPLPGAALTREPAHDTELHEPIAYDASSVDVDYKNMTTDFKNITITQGKTRIQAERAHAVGLDEKAFEDGRWTFQGNVRVDAEERGSTLRSDEAVVEFRDKLITSVTATGKPAEFQQKRSHTGEITKGHADLIVYDVAKKTVRLSKDAWLSDGAHQISGPLVVYNIEQQRMQADSSKEGGRVHMEFQPDNAPKGQAPKPQGGRPHSP
jgi:lipopolysaccharide export system protein LptA